jgi:MFS family permease
MSERDASGAASGTEGLARRARWSVTAVFVVHALVFASWTAHIPEIKLRLGLTDAQLGLALLGAPVGSVAAMLVTGWLLPRLGSRLMVQLTLAGYCLTAATVGLAGSLPWLFATLLGWGMFQGGLDVSMNTQAVTVERSLSLPIMSGLHGGWSIGGFLGAGMGAGLVGLGITLRPQQLVLSPLAGLLAAAWSHRLLPDRANLDVTSTGNRTSHQGASRWQPVVFVLGVIAFASMLCEGAAADWSAVYLHDTLAAAPAVAGLGYALFAAAMLTVRLAGNTLLRRFRPHILLSNLAVVATLGFGTALLLNHQSAALIGLLALGVGVGSVVPTVNSAAGNIPRLNHGTAIATVSAFGWLGFVVGPPLIGHLAAATSLPVALLILPALTALIAISTRTTGALRRR